MMKCIKEKIVVLVIFALMILIGVKYCNDKNGYYLDEIYTYGLSNSEYAPWIMDLKDGDIRNKIITRQEMMDFLTVGENDRFNYSSVYYNQTKDVHPPLYYFLIHTISSIFTGTFSEWIGLGLNLILYLMTLSLLYHLIYKHFGSRENALIVTVMYGLSHIGLSTMMFIRMYMLLTFLTLLLAYLVLEHMKNPKKKLYAAIAITIFLGMITQYYFVIYAFCVCAVYDIYLLGKKEYKKFALFSASALSGVVAMLFFFPHFRTQLSLQETVSMDKTIHNAQSVKKWIPRIIEMCSEASENIKIIFPMFLILAVGLLIALWKKNCNLKKYNHTLIVIVPAFIAYIIVCIIAPYVTERYIYHLIPLMLLMFSYLFSISEKNWKKIISYGILGVVILVSVQSLHDKKPDYVYDHSEFNMEIAGNSDAPCIFVSENSSPSITCALPQLVYFDEVLVVDESGLKEINQYLQKYSETDRVVVFLAAVPKMTEIDLVWQQLLDEGYVEYNQIYENEFISSYIFQR